MRAALVEGKPPSRYPIRGIFVGCCAQTGRQSAKSMAQSVRTVIFLVMLFSALSTRHSTLDTRPFSVAVGTALASGPPHRSVREEFPHTAPTSGLCDGQPLDRSLPYAPQNPVTRCPGSV